ncbi:MAG TPA: phosphohydrolase, partial [Treponemataceae bacterium]|nr:phosphohydrolase [Treponemataceae bacterium]
DIGIHNAEIKYNSCAGNYQEIEGPPIASELLSPLSLTEDVLDRISYLIAHHHTYSNIDGIDYQILIEADFIVNIFEDDMSENQISSIKKKLFKTKSGIELVESLFV